MSEFDPMMDADYREYADLCLRRHCLLSEGKEDSAEITKVEERMDTLWPRLDEAQRRSLKGMASDLNWIRRDGEPPPKGRKTPLEVSAQEQQELSSAIKTKEWHRILHCLRLCAPVFESASLSRERGIVYEAIGLPSYARVFREKAVEFSIAFVKRHPIILTNQDRAVDSHAMESAPKNAVLVWQHDGVKVTAGTAPKQRIIETIEYRVCA